MWLLESLECHGQLGLPWWFSGKESACNAGVSGNKGLIPGPGRSPGGGHGNPLQYSRLENPMDRGAWWATVHGVTKSQIQRSDLAHTHCWQHLLLGGTAPARHPELICRPPPDTHRLQRYTALSLRDAHFFLLRLHLAMVLNELLFAVLRAAHRRIILYHLRHQGSPGKNILVFSF